MREDIKIMSIYEKIWSRAIKFSPGDVISTYDSCN